MVVDVQRGFDDPQWGPRDNPACETNIDNLIALWRREAWPLVYVRHDSLNPRSPLAPDSPGNAFKDVVAGQPDLLVTKHVNSAFHGSPDLHAWLQAEGITQVMVCGIMTNHCCETTARLAGNLGYETFFVLDATHTFDRAAMDGTMIPATTLATVTGANLHGEFATVITTAEALGHHS